MITVNLNSSFNTDIFDTQNVVDRRTLPLISTRCGQGVGFLNVAETCANDYCIPYADSDRFYYQIYTGFNDTYIGWKVTAINTNSGATIWTSELTTTGISGVTAVPTGQNMWFRRTGIEGQNIDFFQINASELNFAPFRLVIEYFDRGLFGTDPAVKVGEYSTPNYCYTNCDTLLIESDYDTTDCQGGIYSNVFPYIWTPLAGVAVEQAYKNIHRIKGGLELTNLSYENRVYTSSGKLTSFISNEITTLKALLPEWGALNLFNVLSGKELKINGKEYRFEGEVPKNNDVNGTWIIETELITKCNKSNLC
jgi:hypothetical protein